MIKTDQGRSMLKTIWNKYVYFGLIRPQDMVSVINVLSLIVFSKLFVDFLVYDL